MERIHLNKDEKTVLRMIAGGITVCPALCVRSLERKGLVKVAYIEGGDSEDIVLTDYGRKLLRNNPKLYHPFLLFFARSLDIKLFGYKIPKKGAYMTKEELQAHLDALCKQNGFDYAKYLGVYNGEEIYQPRFSSNKDILFGRPVFLHVRGDKVRRSRDYKEASKILNYFYD